MPCEAHLESRAVGLGVHGVGLALALELPTATDTARLVKGTSRTRGEGGGGAGAGSEWVPGDPHSCRTGGGARGMLRRHLLCHGAVRLQLHLRVRVRVQVRVRALKASHTTRFAYRCLRTTPYVTDRSPPLTGTANPENQY